MEAEQRARLRAVLREQDRALTAYLQDQVVSVCEVIKVGTTTLDQITYAKGKADGAAELWAFLESLSETDTPGDTPE